MIEDFASRLLHDVARLDPCTAVVEGGEQEVDGLTGYSPDGHQARADLAARALRELHAAATGPLQLIRQAVEAAVPGRDAEGSAHEEGWARVGAPAW
ncbi:hypothetical protein ACIG87_03520 [Micromonospora sp. NPDC051925]|uniref:hypothetical protein n=1 Tax=Micromonospora sp. NPDC051925 TaxID=3364288 RepID=UPI0037C5CA0C